jgi:hypothetical protein
MRLAAICAFLACGCGAATMSPPETRTLGLNDVTVLVPLPASDTTVLLRATDLADDGTPLVPRPLYDMLNVIPNRGPTLIDDAYPRLQVFAARLDLCDRVAPGPCSAGDGRLRVVFQALRPAATPVTTVDAAFHAFYRIPEAELPAVVAELRALAALQHAPLASRLGVSPALTASTTGEYATRLVALIKAHAGTTRLLRLTFFAQPDMFSAIRWVFRGVEMNGNSFSEMTIPTIGMPIQDVTLTGMNSFDVMPVADAPAGFVLATSETAFAAAAPAARDQALRALVAADDPLANTPSTIQCATCHVATHVLADRAAVAGVDPLALGGRYAQAPFDLTVAPISDRTLRALGWLGDTPLIAQRTANESAQAATEIDARFPPAR